MIYLVLKGVCIVSKYRLNIQFDEKELNRPITVSFYRHIVLAKHDNHVIHGGYICGPGDF